MKENSNRHPEANAYNGGPLPSENMQAVETCMEKVERAWDEGIFSLVRKEKRILIDKVCKYLNENFEDIGLLWLRGGSFDDIEKNFIKAMED